MGNTRAYIYAKLQDEFEIRRIRDHMWRKTRGWRFYTSKDPHMTVVPPFTVDSDYKPAIIKIAKSSNLPGKEVSLNRIGVYSSIHKPFVVLIDASANIEDERLSVVNGIKNHCDVDPDEPVSPHITLFKTGSWWSDPPQSLKRSIQDEIISIGEIGNTQISHVAVDFK